MSASYVLLVVAVGLVLLMAYMLGPNFIEMLQESWKDWERLFDKKRKGE